MSDEITDQFRLDLLNGTSTTLVYIDHPFQKRYIQNIIRKYFSDLRIRLKLSANLTYLNLMEFGCEDFGVFGDNLRDYLETKGRTLFDDETRKEYVELLEKYLEFIPSDLKVLRKKLLEIQEKLNKEPGRACQITDYSMVTYEDIDEGNLTTSIESAINPRTQLDNFLSVIRLSHEAHSKLTKIVNLLNQALSDSPLSELGAKLLTFGSYKNGLGCYDCDLDLVAKFEACDSLDLLDYETSWLGLKVIESVFQKRLGFKTDYHRFLVPSRRCPIINLEFVNCLPGIEEQVERINLGRPDNRQLEFNKCDISIRSLYSYNNSKLIELYAAYDRRFYEMVILLKYWAKERINLVGREGVCAYALNLLIVFFLESVKVLPSLEELQKLAPEKEPIRIHRYNFEFCDNLSRIPKSTNLKSTQELLVEFFQFYNTFQYDSYAICPRTGVKVVKDEIHRLTRRLAQPSDISSLFRMSNVTIVDPFVLNSNVGASIQKFLTQKWKQACQKMVREMSVDNCVRLLVLGKGANSYGTPGRSADRSGRLGYGRRRY